MNTENDIKEFGFRHISINTVYNGWTGNGVSPLSRLVINICEVFYPKKSSRKLLKLSHFLSKVLLLRHSIFASGKSTTESSTRLYSR